jgi:hypothetical protein
LAKTYVKVTATGTSLPYTVTLGRGIRRLNPGLDALPSFILDVLSGFGITTYDVAKRGTETEITYVVSVPKISTPPQFVSLSFMFTPFSEDMLEFHLQELTPAERERDLVTL